ncbi:Uncharacterised protein [Streptococcus pyogenes]|nr:Uncharacterised protein [Streptococcus pyogenes]
MGEWIEISLINRKLKCRIGVSPFMGEWVEILRLTQSRFGLAVSPFMGEWIEIKLVTLISILFYLSHPSWVSGLKDEPDLIKREVGFLHAFSQPFI